MNTNVSTASVSMEGLMAMLDSMPQRDRRRIAEHLSAKIDCEEREAEKHLKERMTDAPRWFDDSDARLDSALARFHNDWGGDGSPIEIANELRWQLEQKGMKIGDMDTFIAATALEEGLIVVTGNTEHFSRIEGLKVENWMQR